MARRRGRVFPGCAVLTIARARVLLALFNGVIVYLDPTLPVTGGGYQPLVADVCVLLLLLYSVGALWLGCGRPASQRTSQLTLWLDVLLGSALIESTGILRSPFFLWNAFVLMSAIMNGSWLLARRVLFAQTCFYVGVVLMAPHLTWGDIPLTVLLLRSGYRVLIAAVLAAMAWQVLEQNRMLAGLHRAAAHLSAAHSPGEVLARLAGSASDLLNAKGAAVAAWSGGRAPERCAFANLTDEHGRQLLLAARHCLATAPVAKGPATVTTDDPQSDARLSAACEALADVRNVLVTLLPGSDGAAGVLVVCNRQGRLGFAAADVELAELLAAQAGPLLEAAELQEVRRSQAARDERHRIAGELHDGLVQTLCGLDLRLAACDRLADREEWGELAGEIRALKGVVEEAVDEARGAIHELAPVRLRQEGPSAYLSDCLHRFQRRAGTPVEASIRLADRPTPEPVALLLLGLLREGLNNIRRHARASQVRLAIEEYGDRISFRLSDDGDGFQAVERHWLKEATRHYGLAYLQTRVAAAGGEMRVISHPGQGTVLEAHLPLRDSQRLDQVESAGGARKADWWT